MLRVCMLFMLSVGLLIFGCGDSNEDGIPFNPDEGALLEGGETPDYVPTPPGGGGKDAGSTDPGYTDAGSIGTEGGGETGGDVIVEPPPPPVDCVIAADCNDQNLCTSDSCIGGSCSFVPQLIACDDGDGCTDNDQCVGGSCVGTPLNCDDQNSCTDDYCWNLGCSHTPVETPQCALTVEITSPDRASTLTGSTTINVTGEVSSPVGEVTSLVLNGTSLSVGNTGGFTATINAAHGLNILEVTAENDHGQKATTAQSFAYSKIIHPPGTPAAVTILQKGSGFWLDAEVFDDDDTSDLDDLATMGWMVFDTYDIEEALPDPLFTEEQKPTYSFIGYTCTWDVAISNIQYTVSNVDIAPTTGAITFSGELSNLSAWVDATAPGLCPDAIGEIYASSVTVDATLTVSATPWGTVAVDVEYLSIQINEFDVDIQQGAAAWVDWIINWYEDEISNMIKEELEVWISTELAPMINEILDQVTNYQVEFVIPPLTDGPSLPVFLLVALDGTEFNSEGALFDLNVGMATAKNTSYDSPGFIGRSACSPGGVISNGGGGGGNTGGETGEGMCCEAQTQPGCDDAGCEACVCDMDPYCCSNKWDSICVNEAGSECADTCGCPAPDDSGDIAITFFEEENSCAGSCDGVAPGGCWCDSNCVAIGDCCADVCSECGYCEEGPGDGPSDPTDFAFPKNALVEGSSREDLANQGLFHLWWGGYTKMSIDNTQFAGLLATLGVSNLTMNLDPMLPPLITTCTDNGEAEMQFGDVHVIADFDFNGQPASFEIYASLRVEIGLQVDVVPGGQNYVAVEVKEIKDLAVEVLETNGLGEQGDLLIEALFSDVVVDLLAGDLVQQLTTSYPVPTIQPGMWVPGISLQKEVSFNPETVEWLQGHLVVGGEVLEL